MKPDGGPADQHARLRRELLKGGLFALFLTPITMARASQLEQLTRASDPALPPGSCGLLCESERHRLVAMVDTILPRTETPSASEAGVVDFIDFMLREWATEDEADFFVRGLNELAAASGREFGHPFEALSDESRLAFLRAVQRDSRDPAAVESDAGNFFEILRRLTLFGYYTSADGANSELNVNLVNGQYEPCLPWLPTMRANALPRSQAIRLGPLRS